MASLGQQVNGGCAKVDAAQPTEMPLGDAGAAALSSGDVYFDRLMAAQASLDPAAWAEEIDSAVVELEPDPGYVRPTVTVRDEAAPEPHGDVAVRVYLPPVASQAATEAKAPLFVWCHGGGWLSGDLDMPEADATAREVCLRSGAVVVSVGYRLALPGVHYPVPLDDVIAAWTWSLEQAESWGASPERAVLGGASAGGNLAAGAAMRLRDEDGPLPAAVALVYPALHASLPPLDEQTRTSIGVSARGEEFLARGMTLMLENYLGAPAEQAPAYVCPGDGDVNGLPPTLIITCENDYLRVSGELFAQKLTDAGVPHRLVQAPGVGHAHINTPWLTEAQATYTLLAAWVQDPAR